MRNAMRLARAVLAVAAASLCLLVADGTAGAAGTAEPKMKIDPITAARKQNRCRAAHAHSTTGPTDLSTFVETANCLRKAKLLVEDGLR